HNQGVIPCKQFLITDYIPSGYNWVPQNNWSYISAPRHGKFQWNGLLLSGDSVQIHLKLLIKSIYSGGLDLLNLAELTSATDTSGTIYIKDIDSYYDADPLNDSGGKVNTLSDNFIEDDGFDTDRDNIQDEDDHDPALTPIVDFALRKEILNPDKGNYGDTIEFKITVFNQGNINANTIDIKDYLNKGYSFSANLNPGWQLNGVNPVYSFKNFFPPGQKMETTLKLIVESDTSIASFYNWAEITGSTDLNGSQIGHKDADSNPASDNSNERKVIPGDVNDDNIFGGGPLVNEDEDDHDVAGLNSKASIGDMVWHDKNANGIMDLGEEGIEGISVQLYSSPGNIFIRATKTNKSGKYLFDQVNPGKYYLKFIVNNPWSITDPNKTNDTLDSDVGNFNGVATTETTMLMGGENDKSWDLGLYKCIPISGYVFFDVNQNGFFDLAENGINGLKVYAHDATTGQMVSSTKTFVSDGKIYHDGYFYFCLKPGSYYFRLQALDGFMISPYRQGTDPNLDSDLTNQFGPFTTGIYSGISCDTIKSIGGGVYHPLFKLQSNNDTRINSEYEINSRSGYSENLILQGQQLSVRNILRWTKTSKSCLRYLEILRKEREKDEFESIGFVKLDTSELNILPCLQEWVDLNAIQPLVYEYKLIGIDMDFNVLTSNTITIGNEFDPFGKEYGFDLHPNPAKENIFIYSTKWNDPILGYQVLDIFGTIVKKSNPLNMDSNGKPIEIPLDDLPKGQYFIKAYFRNATKVRGFQLY
ncbi:MAG TPA: SdrD B-like domain-containing protein, partial [Saprospiraceae bacterium]|nr:SdrD B-like domain-containing protein [Saprospiraceae bacterium]